MTKQALINKKLEEARKRKENRELETLEAKLANDSYADFLLNIELQKENFNKLKLLAESAKHYKPVRRATGTVEVRFNKSYTFSDEVINYLIGVVDMVRYAPAEYAAELEVLTNLDELTIAQFSESLGSFAYFSKVDKIVVPAKPTNLTSLYFMLEQVAEKLQLNPIDTSTLTAEFFASKHEQALKEAERLYNNHIELTELDSEEINDLP